MCASFNRKYLLASLISYNTIHVLWFFSCIHGDHLEAGHMGVGGDI